LTKKAGIKTEERREIWVDEYLRTNLSDIFAVGDYTQIRDFITGKHPIAEGINDLINWLIKPTYLR